MANKQLVAVLKPTQSGDLRDAPASSPAHFSHRHARGQCRDQVIGQRNLHFHEREMLSEKVSLAEIGGPILGWHVARCQRHLWMYFRDSISKIVFPLRPIVGG